MEFKTKSIRPFIGAKNFELSRQFYFDLGFKETILSKNLSVFQIDGLSFYLQDAYIKDWIDNSMLFLEVDDLDYFWNHLLKLDLKAKYKEVKIVPIRVLDWGKECFIYDPSGILWHIGAFYK